MFLHLSISHSVHRAGVPGKAPPGTRYTPPRTRYTPPRTRYTPRDQVHPFGQVPPGTRYTSPVPGTPPGTSTPPGTRYTPWDQVHPPGGRYPRPQETATVANGTHPTGIHSCCKLISISLCRSKHISKRKLTQFLNIFLFH